MNTAEAYRRLAAFSFRTAEGTRDMSAKMRLLAVAQGWLELAERVEKMRSLPKCEDRMQKRPRIVVHHSDG